MTPEKIAELISQRRRQVLVHSVLYYRMDSSIIDDRKWDQWARELHRLQTEYPEIAKECPLNREFENFDPASGYDLPLDNLWAVNRAQRLLSYHTRRRQPYERISQ